MKYHNIPNQMPKIRGQKQLIDQEKWQNLVRFYIYCHCQYLTYLSLFWALTVCCIHSSPRKLTTCAETTHSFTSYLFEFLESKEFYLFIYFSSIQCQDQHDFQLILSTWGIFVPRRQFTKLIGMRSVGYKVEIGGEERRP